MPPLDRAEWWRLRWPFPLVVSGVRRSAREYLQVHLANKVTLDDAKEALDLSASTIQRALDATFGLSFHELVERLRIERFLKRLADDPDLKIEAHAREVGWNGKSNLYAAIERVTGHSLASLRDHPALRASVLAELAAPETYGKDRGGGRWRLSGHKSLAGQRA